jgi:hypothetical protein
MKKNELRKYINNKMQEKSAFIPNSPAFMNPVKKANKSPILTE